MCPPCDTDRTGMSSASSWPRWCRSRYRPSSAVRCPPLSIRTLSRAMRSAASARMSSGVSCSCSHGLSESAGADKGKWRHSGEPFLHEDEFVARVPEVFVEAQHLRVRRLDQQVHLLAALRAQPPLHLLYPGLFVSAQKCWDHAAAATREGGWRRSQ